MRFVEGDLEHMEPHFQKGGNFPHNLGLIWSIIALDISQTAFACEFILSRARSTDDTIFREQAERETEE